MSTPVRYHCPRCETVVTIEREGYLADKSVTPYPLEGWHYVSPPDYLGSEEARESADGIRFVCGESPGAEWEGDGCGEPFYLSFVRFEEGVEVEPVPESEYVRLAGVGPTAPVGPAGLRGPHGPG